MNLYTGDLPIHPRLRHPLTGEPLRAVGFRRGGAPIWPMLGAAEDGGQGSGSGADSGSGDGSGGGQGGAGDQGSQGGGQNGGAGDGKGGSDGNDDDGFPKGKPLAEMTPQQQAAYWKDRSQKHEGRFKSLVGDKSFDEAKADLEAHAEHQRSQQTPAEKQLTERYEQGKKDALAESNTKAATAILRANLTARGLADDDVDELVETIAVDKFIVDGDIDTDRIAATANRFTGSATDDQQSTRRTNQRRDFGGGNRSGSGAQQRGDRGKAALERRFGKQKTSAGS